MEATRQDVQAVSVFEEMFRGCDNQLAELGPKRFYPLSLLETQWC